MLTAGCQITRLLFLGRVAEAKSVARRFIRAVARIFVVLNVEMQPTSGKKKSLVLQPLVKCRRVFQVRIYN